MWSDLELKLVGRRGVWPRDLLMWSQPRHGRAGRRVSERVFSERGLVQAR
jgi:hypothetical protein